MSPGFLRLFSWETGSSAAAGPRPLTNSLLPDLKDSVFSHQIRTSDFPRLEEDALLLAEIVPTKHIATKVLRSAHTVGMIDPVTGRPDTSKITKNMVHDMPVLRGISKQREMVMLLFFWEEEIRRWEALEAEEREVRGVLGGVEREEALRVLEARKRVLPSLRDESGEVIRGGEEELPSYEGVGRV